MRTINELIRKYENKDIESAVKQQSIFIKHENVCLNKSKITKTATAFTTPETIEPNKRISVNIDNKISIKKKDLPEAVINLLKKRLTFDNPRYLKAIKFKRPISNLDPHFFCFKETENNILITRGFTSELINILHANRIPFDIKRGWRFPELKFDFYGTLHKYQQDALKEISDRRFGVIVGPESCGKKVLAFHLVFDRKLRTLIIVKFKHRLYQWKEAAIKFLGLQETEIGLIGDGHKKIGTKVTIAIDRSLYRIIDEINSSIGFLIVDHCHSANLKIFFKGVYAFNSPYMLGLSNSIERKDGLTDLMFAYLGPLLCNIHVSEQHAGLKGKRPVLNARRTDFAFEYNENYGEMISVLCKDKNRNELILMDVLQEASGHNRLSLVVSERLEHLKILKDLLSAAVKKSEIISGKTSKTERTEILRKVEAGKLSIVLITQKSLPSLELKSFNALFVACPLKFGNHLAQALGKLFTISRNMKPAVIYDYVDEPGVLKASFNRRLKYYRSLGLAEKG